MAGVETEIRDRSDILLTRRQVEALCRLSTSSIYSFMRDGLFPEPIRVGRRAVRWYASEIDAWLSSRPRATGDCWPSSEGEVWLSSQPRSASDKPVTRRTLEATISAGRVAQNHPCCRHFLATIRMLYSLGRTHILV